jgi:hypothetical protein
MKYWIDFSLFVPGTAWGNITGDIELPGTLSVGDRVDLGKGIAELTELGFPDSLRVETVTPPSDYDAESTEPLVALLMLEDVFAESGSAALAIADLLEQELGLFADQYDEAP